MVLEGGVGGGRGGVGSLVWQWSGEPGSPGKTIGPPLGQTHSTGRLKTPKITKIKGETTHIQGRTDPDERGEPTLGPAKARNKEGQQ